MTIVRRSRPPVGRAARRRAPLGLAAAVVLVLAALGLTSCSTTASNTVTLEPARPGQVSVLVAHRFDSHADHQEIRFTSGTGRSIVVQSYAFQNGNIGTGVAPTTVVDTGPSGPWVTVAPGYTFGTTPQDVALRLTTTGTADLTLSYEIRGVNGLTQTGQASTISATGADCARAPDHTDLRAVDLSGLDLRGCFLAGSTLDAAKLASTKLRGADLSQATILAGRVNGADLAYAQLGDSHLAGVDLKVGELWGVVLTHANLDHVILSPVGLFNSDLDGVDLSTATLDGIWSFGLTGTPTLPPGWFKRGGSLLHAGVNLTGANLGDVDLSGLDLTGANFTSGWLRGANLQGTNLTNAILTGADLEGATGTPIYTGAHFQDTGCPDGTVSTNNVGQTCQGHPWP